MIADNNDQWHHTNELHGLVKEHFRKLNPHEEHGHSHSNGHGHSHILDTTPRPNIERDLTTLDIKNMKDVSKEITMNMDESSVHPSDLHRPTDLITSARKGLPSSNVSYEK